MLFLPAHKQTAMRTVIEAVEVGMQKTQETLTASKSRMIEKVSQTMDEEAKKVMDDLQS